MANAIKEANFIWREYIAAQINENDIERLNEFYNYIKENHNDFSDDFEFILRTMVYCRSYNKKTFKYYMENMNKLSRSINSSSNSLNTSHLPLKILSMIYRDSYIEDYSIRVQRFYKIAKQFWDNPDNISGTDEEYQSYFKTNKLMFEYLIELNMYNYKSFISYHNNNCIRENVANTKDETIITANFIYNLYRSYKNTNESITVDQVLNRIHDFLLKHHKTFCSSYPIVVKYMVYMNQYSEKALDMFLLHWKNNVPRDRNDYYKVWAKYPHNLYRYPGGTNKTTKKGKGKGKRNRYDPKVGAKIEQDAYDRLIEEYNDWENAIKKAEKKFDEEKELSIQRKKDDIKKALLLKLATNPAKNTNTPNVSDVSDETE